MSSPHTTILVVDDEVAFAQVIGDHLRKAGHTILMAADAEGALKHLEKKRPDLVLLDVNLPGISGIELIESMRGDKRLPTTVVMSAYGDLETALKAVRAGAVDFLAKPFRLPALELKVEIALERARFDSKTTQRRASGQRQAEAERPDEQKLESSSDLQMYHGMIGRGAKMTALFKMIDRVAQFTSTVLVHGESGTGKELVAKALHRASPRATGPFIAVNCGAIPENLLESELFGHVRGAFTDATQDRKGLFEQAHRGTLLLDEIVDLPLHLQVKLLRALQEGEV